MTIVQISRPCLDCGSESTWHGKFVGQGATEYYSIECTACDGWTVMVQLQRYLNRNRNTRAAS